MTELAGAVEAANWPVALREAIVLWRETRDPLVARLVDRITARCERQQAPPARELQQWWVARARHYDPVIATTLLDCIAIRLRSSDVRWRVAAGRWVGTPLVEYLDGDDGWQCAANWLERFAAIETWPDDPRLAPILASWFVGHVAYVRPDLLAGSMRLLAARLARLADVRIAPRLAAFRRDEPAAAAGRAGIDDLQAAIDRVQPRAAGVERLVGRLEEPTTIERLWRQAARDRADRGVLGDALVAANDARGTFIGLQLAPDPRRARRAERLLAVEWDRWLGPDLASLAVRDGTVFRDGMIEELRVGHHFTPRWAWTAVAGHHELGAVHTLRASVVDNSGYARLASGLAELRSLEIDSMATLTELATLGVSLPVTRIQVTGLRSQIAPHEFFARLRRVAPDVGELAFTPAIATDEFIAAIPPSVRVVR